MKASGPDSCKGMIRDRVAAESMTMIERLRLHCSMLPNMDLEVLRLLEKPIQFDLAVDLANFVMAKLGDESKPSESRFDKTRRALGKRRGRGVLTEEDQQLLAGGNRG